MQESDFQCHRENHDFSADRPRHASGFHAPFVPPRHSTPLKRIHWERNLQDRDLHHAWTSNMDITTSLRDMTLFNMLGDYFHKKFEREQVCQSVGVLGVVSVCGVFWVL